ncbi:hypothetical protein [Streptomyces sp. NBC_00334]|uniref:hypothetical protein n=1 Tax=Streptomyces sp. NBC_00334 TaxID=2975713 RepID=UPI002E28F237|nr:hypothetical protein [Streptomyces sp. NBC_00334]
MTLALAVLLAAAVGWCWGHSTARIRIIRIPSGPPAPFDDGVVAVALAGACCDMWWTSAGAEHTGPCLSRWATRVACCPECSVAPGAPCHQDGQPLAAAHDRRIQEAKETR